MESAGIRQTERFAQWFDGLRDETARGGILIQRRRLSLGNPGDVRPMGGGVSELRMDDGPGYRVYVMVHGSGMAILLAGGRKGSQALDIAAAQTLARSIRKPEGR